MKKINKVNEFLINNFITLQYAQITHNKLKINNFFGLCIKNNKNKTITLKKSKKKVFIILTFFFESPIIINIYKLNFKLKK